MHAASNIHDGIIVTYTNVPGQEEVEQRHYNILVGQSSIIFRADKMVPSFSIVSAKRFKYRYSTVLSDIEIENILVIRFGVKIVINIQ